MTKQEELGNRIIAEFIEYNKLSGYVVNDKLEEDRYVEFDRDLPFKFTCLVKESELGLRCRFHVSWEWLIEACKLFQSIPIETIIRQGYRDKHTVNNLREHFNRCQMLSEAVGSYNIEASFKQLVKNINWYNNNKVNRWEK